MKKRVLLFSLVAIFFAGMQSSLAQTMQSEDNKKIISKDKSFEELAKSKSQALKSLLDLSEKQEYSIMKVLRITEPKKTKIKNTNYSDKVQAQRDLQSIMNYEMDEFKKILSESQFKLYSDSLKRKG